MAKRRHQGEIEIPFVALMDTLTNVVGVLTIVFVTVGLGLANAVNKIMSDLPPATPQQIAEMAAQLSDAEKKKALDQARLASLSAAPVDLQRLKSLESELGKTDPAALKAIEEPEKLKKLLARLEDELKEKKKLSAELQEERSRLKAQLTSVAPALAAKVVRLPAGKPIPKEARIRNYLVIKSGAYFYDQAAAKQAFVSFVTHGGLPGGVSAKTVKQGNGFKTLYNDQQIKRFFESKFFSYQKFLGKATFVPWSTSPVVVLTPREPEKGFDLQAFKAELQDVKRSANTVAMFQVSPEGFETYLAARQACDDIGLPAGWEFYGGTTLQILADNLETTHPLPPPPPPATAAARPAAPPSNAPKPLEIKPPARKLD